MNQHNFLIALLVIVTGVTGAVVGYDVVKKKGGLFNRNNWQWSDNWNGSGPSKTAPDKEKPVSPPVDNPSYKNIAGSYKEALEISGQSGKPVLVFFTADWCSYCRKMKSEAMADARVTEVLKNYILVYVDTDKDRESTAKFRITKLPSQVITNYKEEKLKFNAGYMQAEPFAKWLNNPELYSQPKKDDGAQPSPPENKPEEKPRRPFWKK